jgi:hypothetical protein
MFNANDARALTEQSMIKPHVDACLQKIKTAAQNGMTEVYISCDMLRGEIQPKVIQELERLGFRFRYSHSNIVFSW